MRNRGFTLLEIILAIGLSGAVIGLLTMAIDLYLVRVDASRSRVETAQLARTLLNQIATDLQAVRFSSPSSGNSGSSGSSGGSFGEDGSGASSSDSSADSTPIEGIFGTITEIRIDRSAVWSWENLARLSDIETANMPVDDSPNPTNMPQTVRYILGDGKELLAAEQAAQGVSELAGATDDAGLYREQMPTAAWIAEYASLEAAQVAPGVENAQLIAPEVVDIEFAYFDGEQLLDEWDSSESEALPVGVEIRLTLLSEPFAQLQTGNPEDRDELRRKQKNLVEYRRFVLLGKIEQPYEAEFPQAGQSPQGQSPQGQSPGGQSRS